MARTKSVAISPKVPPVKQERLKIPPMGGAKRVSTSIPFAAQGRSLGEIARIAKGRR